MGESEAKYHLLQVGQRREIIEKLKLDKELNIKTNYSKIARQYNVSTTTICRIRKTLSSFETELSKYEEMPSLDFRKRVPSAKNKEMENILYDWFKKKRSLGEPVFTSTLKQEALQINKRLGGNSDFKASNGWISRFKERHQIRLFSSQLEKAPDEENILEFVNELNNIRRLHDFQIYQIYNADETGLFWKLLPEAEFLLESDQKYLKFSKERLTIMACTNVDGSHKIPLFIIGKSKHSGCLKNLKKLPVIYDGQQNAWMTRKLFAKWYKDIFLTSIKRYQAKRKQKYPVLLILDNAVCHLSKEELEAIDSICTVQYLPPKMNTLIQPINQGIIDEIKKSYRQSLLREMLLEESSESVVAFLKSKTMRTCCIQIASVWSEISEMNVRRAWQKLIPDIEIEGSQSSELTTDDFLSLIHRIPGFERMTNGRISKWLEADATESSSELANAKQLRFTSEQNDPLQMDLHDYQSENDNVTIKMELEDAMSENDENDVKIKIELPDFEEEKSDDLAEESEEEDSSDNEETMDLLKSFEKFRDWYGNQRGCKVEDIVFLQKISERSKFMLSQSKRLK